jgi:S1-C subfamily serine protease
VDPSIRRSRRAVEILIAALAGGAVVLGGAAALGKLDSSTTVVREVANASGESAAFSEPHHMSINDVYRAAAPGVVHIDAVTKTALPADPFFGTPGGTEVQRAIGSGFVIDKAGHIVTNEHVVAGASSVQVSFSDNEKIKAKVVGQDAATDVAVLQVDAAARALKPLPLGDSDAVRVGDQVIAIGNPLGYDRSVTSGIVSAVGREIQSPNAEPIGHVIQTDAALNHGNSGGPLLNADGQVIGVNAQIAPSASNANIGIGFAIPISTVKQVAAELIKHGKVAHPFIGIRVQPLTPDIARVFHLPVQHGLLIAKVYPGTGAERAGLKAGKTLVTVNGESWPADGDIIVRANGHPVATVDQLLNVISEKKPGDTVRLDVYRGTKHLTVNVRLGRLPSSPP